MSKGRSIPWKTVVHLSGWLIYWIMLSSLFTWEDQFDRAMIRSLMLVLPQATIFYLNYFLLQPRLFEQKKYLLYFSALILLLILGMMLMMQMGRGIHLLLGDPHANLVFPRRGPPGKGFWDMRRIHGFRGINLLFGINAFVALFFSNVLRSIADRRNREREAAALQNKVLEAERNLLISQINPHFLFNALNNIYALSKLQSAQTPEAIHQLSEILRYVIYESRQGKVSLAQEISYLENYIQLQLLKDEDIQGVEFTAEGTDRSLMIAPMLLIPIVENSFKHSGFEDVREGWIRISLSTEGRLMRLKVENSLQQGPKSVDQTGGIGLENLKKRLDLLYPGRHQLNISESESTYSVHLEINCDGD